MKHVIVMLLMALLAGAAVAQTPPPTGLSAVDDGNGNVILTWNAPSGIDGVSGPADLIEWPANDMERATFQHPNMQELRQEWNAMHGTGELDEFINYRVYRNYALIGTATTETFQDQPAQAGSYTYWVTAYYDEGESVSSNHVTITFYDPDSYVISEDFDDGMPDSWTIESDIVTLAWHVDFGDERGLFPTPYALVDSDAPGSCPHIVTRMITPEFSTVGGNIVELSYSYILNVYIDERGYVDMRADGGDWVNIAEYNGDDLDPVDVVHDLTDDYLDQDNLQLSFLYDDLGNWGWYWAVDGVRVYLGSPAEPVILDLVGQQTVIPYEGGNLIYDVSLESTIGASYTGLTFWTEVQLPNGQVFGPLLTQNFNLVPFMDVYVPQMSQPIPALAPAGEYEYRGLAGFFPIPSIGDGLSFTKEDAPTGAPGSGEMSFDPAEWTPSGDLSALTGEAVVAADAALPAEFALDNAYPNPFNGMTTLNLRLPETAEVSVAVYDVTGRQVATLADGGMNAGTHRLAFDASGLASGVYFVHATVPGQLNQVRKLALVK